MFVKSQNPLFGEVHIAQDLILLWKISVSRHRRGLEKCDFINYPESNLPGSYSACPVHGESQQLRFQLLDWPIKYPESNLPGMFCLTSTMLVFFRKVPILSEKQKLPFLPRDYCGALFCLILIHRKALETLCLVTGLAQWAGTRIRSGMEGREGTGFDSGHDRE